MWRGAVEVNMAHKTGVVFDVGCLEHDMGRYHPETPKRLQVLMDLMTSSDVKDLGIDTLKCTPATQDDVLRVHSEAYFRRIMATQGRTVVLDMDTIAGPKSFDAAMLSAGCGLAAANAVLSGEVRNAMAFCRPPGHHSEPDKAMGFCIFNNIAIVARHARDVLGLKRVAIVDFDLHHGNGTQKAFYSDPTVLYISTHQYPYYPFTGAVDDVGDGEGRGTTVNIPLAAGHGDEEYAAIYGGLIPRILRQFEPELILVSAGFDIFSGDPLGQMEVTAEGFGRIASHLKSTAEELCDGRLVMLLEGGYSLSGLRDGVLACLVALTRDQRRQVTENLEALPLGDALRHLPVYREYFQL